MKLVCSQAELNASLQLVSRAVAGRPTHPVLANVLLTADAGTGRLSLTGFDLSLGIQTSLSASVHTSGAITLLCVSSQEHLLTHEPLRTVNPVGSSTHGHQGLGTVAHIHVLLLILEVEREEHVQIDHFAKAQGQSSLDGWSLQQQ